MRLAEAVRFTGGLLLAAALFAWVLRGTSLAELGQHLRQASIPGLVAAATLNLSHNLFRTWRWRALLAPVRERLPFRPMFDAIVLGYATSAVVPGRIGELVRPALLARRERLPLAPCLGSVLADRLLDGVAVLTLFAFGAAMTPLAAAPAHHAAAIRTSALAMVALIAVPLAILVLAGRGREQILEWLGDRTGWRRRLGHSLVALADGVAAFKRPRLVLVIAFHTLFAWLLIAAGTWVGVRAAGVELSFGGTLLLLPLLVLGIALPTPGGAGGYHAAMRVGLVQLFGVAEPLAVGAGILQHAAITLPILALGGILLAQNRISLRTLLGEARQVPEPGVARAAEGPEGAP